MKYLMSEEEAAYQTIYQGHFSRKLASWAIGNMQVEDAATKQMKPVTVRPFEDVMEVLKANGVNIPEESRYDAWYVFMMSKADYQKTLPSDRACATYVDETICDPDGDPTNVLACFVAKMCNKGIPVMWDLFV